MSGRRAAETAAHGEAANWPGRPATHRHLAGAPAPTTPPLPSPAPQPYVKSSVVPHLIGAAVAAGISLILILSWLAWRAVKLCCACCCACVRGPQVHVRRAGLRAARPILLARARDGGPSAP